MDWDATGFAYFDFYTMWNLILRVVGNVYSFVQHQPFVFIGLVVAGTLLSAMFVPLLKKAWIGSFF